MFRLLEADLLSHCCGRIPALTTATALVSDSVPNLGSSSWLQDHAEVGGQRGCSLLMRTKIILENISLEGLLHIAEAIVSPWRANKAFSTELGRMDSLSLGPVPSQVNPAHMNGQEPAAVNGSTSIPPESFATPVGPKTAGVVTPPPPPSEQFQVELDNSGHQKRLHAASSNRSQRLLQPLEE